MLSLFIMVLCAMAWLLSDPLNGRGTPAPVWLNNWFIVNITEVTVVALMSVPGILKYLKKIGFKLLGRILIFIMRGK